MIALIRTWLVLLVLGTDSIARLDTFSNSLIFNSVQRTVDVSSQLVKIKVQFILQNNGTEPLYSFILAVERVDLGHLAYLSIHDSSSKQLRLVDTTISGIENLHKFWRVELRNPLHGDTKLKMTAKYIYTNVIQPYPAEISQGEHQFVRVSCNMYFYTPYFVIKQRTYIFLGTMEVRNFTKSGRSLPLSLRGTSLTYGPYRKVPPYSKKELSVYYKNDSPFLNTILERTIKISQWGSVAVEDHIKLLHSGARLKGPFSRYFYEKEKFSKSEVNWYHSLLPAAASNVYYRDALGNISTAILQPKEDGLQVLLRLRYPLFGGWRSHYVLGYSLPTDKYVFRTGDRMTLRIRMLDRVHDNMHIAHMVTRVVLPKGSKHIKLWTPYEVRRLPDALLSTGLDVRPVVSYSRYNLVEYNVQYLQLSYIVPSLYMFRQPLKIVGLLCLIFIFIIVCIRIDFSIIKGDYHHNQD